MSALRTCALRSFPATEPLNRLLAPAGTPKDAVKRASQEIQEIVKRPEIKKRLDDFGIDACGTSPANFTALMKKDFAAWSKIIAAANVKLD